MIITYLGNGSTIERELSELTEEERIGIQKCLDRLKYKGPRRITMKTKDIIVRDIIVTTNSKEESC